MGPAQLILSMNQREVGTYAAISNWIEMAAVFLYVKTRHVWEAP